MLMKLSRYFFYAFVFLLPLQTVLLVREPMIGGEKWQYGTIGVYATDILFMGALILLFVIPGLTRDLEKKQGKRRSQVKPGMTRWWFGVFIVWALLSLLWAPDKMLAGYFVVKLMLAVGVFLIARSLGEREVRIVVMLLFGGAVIQSLLGIMQFLTQATFVSSWLGMSGHEAWQAGTSVLKLDSGRFLRAYGTLPHPNMLGGYLATVVVLGTAWVVLRPSSILSSQRGGWKWWSIFLSGGMVTILLGLLVTFSRSAWVGTVVGMLVLVFLSVWQLFIRSSRNSAVLQNVGETLMTRVFMVFCMATLIFSWVLHETVLPRFESRVIEREHSVSERVQSFEDVWEVMSEKNIWLGAGGGNFTAAVIQAQPERPLWSIQPAHNVFVLVLVELGVVGVVLFILFLISLVWSALRERSSVFFAVFGVLFLSLCLDHWLWSTHFGLLFLFLMLGLSTKRYHDAPSD